jgi:glycosyltransferase involved in cell wall biosynthesis
LGAAKVVARECRGQGLKVCLVAPTCRDSAATFGGGERYVEELAKAMSERCETRLVSFAPKPIRELPKPRFERVVLKSLTRDPLTPVALGLKSAVHGFDVIHAFQYFTLPTFLAAYWGRKQKSKVFITDLGGGGWTPGYQIDQSRWIDCHLAISDYAASVRPGQSRPCRVVYGGVNLVRYRMREGSEHDQSVVFLGRLLPHKGVHILIQAMVPGCQLHVIGPPADPAYLRRLHELAAGKQVQFHHGLSDDDVIRLLQKAMALVHPTPVDASGSAGAHELLGLAVLEAMACGCPVIASRVASLPEIVEDGSNGFLVEPNEPNRIRERLKVLQDDSRFWSSASRAARRGVEARFTWEATADRCLSTYESVDFHDQRSGLPR